MCARAGGSGVSWDLLALLDTAPGAAPTQRLNTLHALLPLQVLSVCQLHEGKTHTDFLLEDAMAGGRDYLAEAVLSVVRGQNHQVCLGAGPVCVRMGGGRGRMGRVDATTWRGRYSW